MNHIVFIYQPFALMSVDKCVFITVPGVFMKPFHNKVYFISIMFCFLFIPLIAHSQKSDTDARKGEKAINKPVSGRVGIRVYKDSLQRDTPRSALRGFLAAARDGDLKKAVNYLDFGIYSSQMTEKEKEEYAQELRIVLDRALWVDLSLISDTPEGNKDDSLPDNRERIAQLTGADGKIVDIIVQRITLDSGLNVWLFSSSTVRRIPELYKKYGYGALGDKLSEIFPSYTFMYLELWQWGFLILLALASFITVYIPTKIVAIVLMHTKFALKQQLAHFATHSFRIFLFFLVSRIFLFMMKPPAVIRVILQAQTLFLVSVIWVFCSLLGLLRDYLKIKLEKQNRMTAAVLLQPATNLVRLLVIVIIVMVWFENIGLNAATVLTGFGIGGLAVALAAQKSIENFIGAVTIHASAPVKLGDFGKFGNYIGSVEFIGLRYTRIRTLDRTLVSVPNAVFVDMSLESFTERDKIRYQPVVKLSRDTTPEQLKTVLEEMRNMLKEHKMVENDKWRVRFKEIGEYSLDLSVVAYIKTEVYSEFLEVAEELNLKTLEIISESGASLAIPARCVKLDK